MAQVENDPFVQKILWDRLITIADETVNALVRTSFSMNVRESYDLSCVIFDEKARSISQGTFSVPTFTGTAPKTLEAMLQRFPIGTFVDGDVFVTNDAWLGTGHVYDINICRPVFSRGRLLGYVMSITHLPDIGGAGMSSITREAYEEGLIIPVQKISIAGIPNEGLLEIIRANVRAADQVMGDITANMTCTEVGARSVRDFCDEYGLDALSGVGDAIIGRTRAALEDGLAALPVGRYENTIQVEGTEEDVTLHVTIERTTDGAVIDFAGSSPQLASSLNVPFCYTRAMTYYTMKCLFGAELPNNEGTFSILDVRAPEGSVLNAKWPVATGARHTIGHYVFPLIMGALKSAVPDRVVTEMGMIDVFNVFGKHADGSRIASLFFMTGGYGSLLGYAGSAAVPGPSNMTSISTEVWEDLTSSTIRYRRVLADSGGAGEFPGGPGQEIEFENSTTNDMVIAFLGLRTRIAAKGIFGGGDGALRRFMINGQEVDGKGRYTIRPGETVRIMAAGAGGLGNADNRSADDVRRDIERGYLTPEHARRHYPQFHNG
jgi:N-methylhydantoinase B